MRSIFFRGFLGLFLIGSAAAHESGFYTGVGAIFSQSDSRTEAKGVNGVNSADATFIKPAQQITARLLGGYQYTLPRNSFVAAEIFAMPQDGLRKFNFQLADGAAVTQSGQLNTKRDFTIGLNLKYGRYFDSKTAVFVGLGILGSRFTSKYTDLDQSIKNRSFSMGVSPTVGLMYHIKPKLPLNLSYSYDIYKAFKTKNMDLSASDDTLFFTHKNRFHIFMVSLSCTL